MKDTRWDHGLKVAGEGEGLVGHAGAVLLRKLADQAGLTGSLGPALARAGKFPLVDRGLALVSMAVAITLGAASMNDIALLAHHAPVLGTEPSDIRKLSASAWQAGLDQDGTVQEDKHVAELTHLLSRAAGWPAGLRWIVRRTKPSRRQAKNLTTFEKATGWRYSIIVTNIPGAGIPGVPGSHHPQFIDVTHREHAVVEDGVRAGKAMGLRNLPSKTWQVNCGWVLAANIAADLSAWCRLLGLYDCDDLKDAEPGTLRYRLWALPARLVRHARQRILKISCTWPWKDAFLACWQRLCALPEPA